jgi:hypothetical protein
MTVVLKGGTTTNGLEIWFDEVRLVEVDESAMLDSVSDQSPFDHEWDTLGWPEGDYEVTMTVYDAALNHASITQTNSVVVVPGPWISTNPSAQDGFSHSIEIGDSLLDDTLEVWNAQTETLVYDIYVEGSPSWITGVVPPDGTSTGPANQHAIQYDTSGLPPGEHQATLRIEGYSLETSDPAGNSPVYITTTVVVQGVKPDIDQDGDVDVSDFAILQDCMSPELGAPPPAGCDVARMDSDQDVDSQDANRFMQCLTGKNVLADKTCDDNF